MTTIKTYAIELLKNYVICNTKKDEEQFFVNSVKLHLHDIRSVVQNCIETKAQSFTKSHYERTLYEYLSTLKELHDFHGKDLDFEIKKLTDLEKKGLNDLFLAAFPENNPIIDVSPQKFLELFPSVANDSYVVRARKFLVYALTYLSQYECEDL